MCSRGLLFLSLVLALGCQDKKPDGSAPAGGSASPAVTTAEATPSVPAPPAIDGTIEGKTFRPGEVSVEALKDWALLIFSRTDGGRETSIQVQLPVPDTEKVGGREWTVGGKVDDPVVTIKQQDTEKPE